MGEIHSEEQMLSSAHGRTAALVVSLVSSGLAPDDIADTLIVKALAVWAAHYDRELDAKVLLEQWVKLRDFRNGGH